MERIRRNRLGEAPCPKKTLGWKKVEGYEPWSEPLGLASAVALLQRKLFLTSDNVS